MRFYFHSLDAGVALVSALIMLIALLAIGAAAAHMALDAGQATRAERDRQMAFQLAEAGLADAQRDIEGGSDPASARAATGTASDARVA